MKNDFANCKKLNDEILRKKPKNAIALSRKMDILESEEKWEDLIELFEDKIKYFKKDILIYSYYLYIYYRSIKKSSPDQEKINFILKEAPITKDLPYINFYNLGIMYYQENRKKYLIKILERIKNQVILENWNEEQRDNLKRWAVFTETNI